MTVSSGIAMEIHYCMGKKAGVDFYKTENEKCGRCGMTEKKNGCCSDEHKFFKLKDLHKNVSNELSFHAGEAVIETAYPLFDWQITGTKPVCLLQNNSPPPDNGPSLRILYGVFRI